MNKLIPSKQAAVLKGLTEGVSLRSVSRMTGVSKTTILKLLVDVGELCAIYQDQKLRNLPCKRVEADEIWAFAGAKQKNATQPGQGDLWTFTAIDADSKLMIAWLVGTRSVENAHLFMKDVASRLAHRVQLTTDGHTMYLTAVEAAFGWNGVDFSQLVKVFGEPAPEDRRRYSTGKCIGAEKNWVMGNPDVEHVSTSYVERSNLTLRMGNRRFTRLTNAFSRKVENHAHSVALHMFVANFCRPHGTLTKRAGGVHTTPAMVAGLTDHVWKIEDLVGMLDPQRLLQ